MVMLQYLPLFYSVKLSFQCDERDNNDAFLIKGVRLAYAEISTLACTAELLNDIQSLCVMCIILCSLKCSSRRQVHLYPRAWFCDFARAKDALPIMREEEHS